MAAGAATLAQGGTAWSARQTRSPSYGVTIAMQLPEKALRELLLSGD